MTFRVDVAWMSRNEYGHDGQNDVLPCSLTGSH